MRRTYEFGILRALPSFVFGAHPVAGVGSARHRSFILELALHADCARDGTHAFRGTT